MVRALAGHGAAAEVHATDGPSGATALARNVVADGLPAIAVRGGNGTVNDALQAVSGGETSLAAWAGGPTNVLAGELDLPREIEPVAATIAHGRMRRIAVGQANNRYVSHGGPSLGSDAALPWIQA